MIRVCIGGYLKVAICFHQMAYGCTINVLDILILGLVFAIVVVSNWILIKAIVVFTKYFTTFVAPFCGLAAYHHRFV